MKVSIIIPVYNAEKYLEECIESALNQTYPETEVIAVNDGSTDGSLKILEKYSDKIKIITKQNGGFASALNLGIQNMSGEWFKWLSADDVLYPNAVEELVKETQNLKDKENFILYSNFDQIDSHGKIIGQFREPNYNEMDQFKFNTILLDRHIGNGTTSLIHKSVFDKYGKFDEQMGWIADYELFLRLCINYNCRLHLVPKVLAKYRFHEKQISALTINEDIKKANMVRELVLKRIDPVLKEKYLRALTQYRKTRPFKSKAKTAIGKMMNKLLPTSISQKIYLMYLNIEKDMMKNNKTY